MTDQICPNEGCDIAVVHRHGTDSNYRPRRWSEPTKQRPGDQRLPQGGQVCVQDLVIAEMQESKRVGVERYGSTLMTFNGRRSIQDVAEEVRDLHVYLTQVKAEADADRATLIEVVAAALRRDDPLADLGYDDIAEAAVDAIMGWVTGQRMGARDE